MSMLRSVLTYMGLGPDEDYDDGYLYDGGDHDDDHDHDHEDHDDDRGRRRDLGRQGRARPIVEASDDDLTIDVRDHDDPHSQRRRPDWLSAPAGASRSSGAQAEGATVPVETHRISAETPSRDSVRPLRAVPPADFDPEVDDGVTIRSVPAGRTTNGAGSETVSGPRYVKPRALAPQSFGEAKILADEFKSSVPVIMNLQGVERDLARRLIDFASGICYALDGSMEKIASQVFLITPSSVEVSDEDRQQLERRGYE